MGGFKRLCLIVMALCTLAVSALGALMLTDFYGVRSIVLAHLAFGNWLFITICTLLAIVGLGALIMLGVGLFARGKLNKLVDVRESGTIEISKTALESSARRAIEEIPGLLVDEVTISIVNGHSPSMFAHAIVGIGHGENLSELGEYVQRKVKESLEAFSGYVVSGVDVKFFDLAERNRTSVAGE